MKFINLLGKKLSKGSQCDTCKREFCILKLAKLINEWLAEKNTGSLDNNNIE